MANIIPAIAKIVTRQSAKVRCMNKVVVLFFLILVFWTVLGAAVLMETERAHEKRGLADYKKAAKMSNELDFGVVFAQVNLRQYPELEEELKIETYPRILFYVNGFPAPRRYFKKYGLQAERICTWLENRIELLSTLNQSTQKYLTCASMFQCDDRSCIPFENVCDKNSTKIDLALNRFEDFSDVSLVSILSRNFSVKLSCHNSRFLNQRRNSFFPSKYNVKM
mgnify:CR=1 FL=1